MRELVSEYGLAIFYGVMGMLILGGVLSMISALTML